MDLPASAGPRPGPGLDLDLNLDPDPDPGSDPDSGLDSDPYPVSPDSHQHFPVKQQACVYTENHHGRGQKSSKS